MNNDYSYLQLERVNDSTCKIMNLFVTDFYRVSFSWIWSPGPRKARGLVCRVILKGNDVLLVSLNPI